MEFLTVTPGIRLASDNVNDQKRVTTPAMARNLLQVILLLVEQLQEVKILWLLIKKYIKIFKENRNEKNYC